MKKDRIPILPECGLIFYGKSGSNFFVSDPPVILGDGANTSMRSGGQNRQRQPLVKPNLHVEFFIMGTNIIDLFRICKPGKLFFAKNFF